MASKITYIKIKHCYRNSNFSAFFIRVESAKIVNHRLSSIDSSKIQCEHRTVSKYWDIWPFQSNYCKGMRLGNCL